MIVTVSLVALLLIGISASRGEKGANDSTSEPSSKPADDLKAQVTSILQNRCAQCHKKVDRLMVRVDPKVGLKNKLYRQVARGHNPKGRNGACTADEVKVIAAWINSLSASSQPASQPASRP
jgi:uncharacterized membrane protein